MALCQDMNQCKVIYKALDAKRKLADDLRLAGDREELLIQAESQESIRNRLDSALQAVREARTPNFLVTVEEQRKFAGDIGEQWNPGWSRSREAFLSAMEKAYQRQATAARKSADAVTARMKNDPGRQNLNSLYQKQQTTKSLLAEAEKIICAGVRSESS